MGLGNLVRKLFGVTVIAGALAATTPALADEPKDEHAEAEHSDDKKIPFDQVVFNDTTLRSVIQQDFPSADFLMKVNQWKMNTEFDEGGALSLYGDPNWTVTLTNPANASEHVTFQVLPQVNYGGGKHLEGWSLNIISKSGPLDESLTEARIQRSRALGLTVPEYVQETPSPHPGFRITSPADCVQNEADTVQLLEKLDSYIAGIESFRKSNVGNSGSPLSKQQRDAYDAKLQDELTILRALRDNTVNLTKEDETLLNIADLLDQGARLKGVSLEYHCLTQAHRLKKGFNGLPGITASFDVLSSKEDGVSGIEYVMKVFTAHERVLENEARVPASKIANVTLLKTSTDFKTIATLVADVDGSYVLGPIADASQLEGNGESSERTAKSYSRATPPTTATRTHHSPTRPSVSKKPVEPVSLDVVLDANALKTLVGYEAGEQVTSQGVINKAFSWAANKYHNAKAAVGKVFRNGKEVSVTSAAWHAPKDAKVAYFEGDANAVRRATAYTGLNALDASNMPEAFRDTVLIDAQSKCTPAMRTLGDRLKADYNARFSRSGYTINDVKLVGCGATSPSIAKPTKIPRDKPIDTKPGADTPEPVPGSFEDNFKDFTPPGSRSISPPNVHQKGDGSDAGLDHIIKYAGSVKAHYKTGMLQFRESLTTDEGQLAATILSNASGAVRRYDDRLKHVMALVQGTNNSNALQEIADSLSLVATSRYATGNDPLQAKLTRAVAVVRDKADTLRTLAVLQHNPPRNTAGTKYANESDAATLLAELSGDNTFATPRQRADGLYDMLNTAITGANFDLATRLAEKMSPNMLLAAEDRAYAKEISNHKHERRLKAFYDITLPRAQEQAYAAQLYAQSQGAGMKVNRMYAGVQSALVAGDETKALQLICWDGLLTRQHLAGIELGLNKNRAQLRPETIARLSRFFDEADKYAQLVQNGRHDNPPRGGSAAPVSKLYEQRPAPVTEYRLAA